MAFSLFISNVLSLRFDVLSLNSTEMDFFNCVQIRTRELSLSHIFILLA